MEIYLTFDDGIQAGTEEVLDVLSETGVKATFFLIGAQVLYTHRKNPDLCKKLLKNIFENHSFGSHSYSHANYLYNSYYKNNGIQIDREGNKRSVVDDFYECERIIGNLMAAMDPNNTMAGNFLLANSQKKALARLPARNTWYLTRMNFRQGASPIIFSNRREKDSIPIAKELNEFGYEVFGWNVEWKMNYDYQKEAIEIIDSRKLSDDYDFSNEESVHPDFDMYAPGEEAKDRLSENWKSCYEKIMSMENGKIILLMHDRAFRRGDYMVADKSEDGPGRTIIASEELKFLIMALQKENVTFRKLDEY